MVPWILESLADERLLAPEAYQQLVNELMPVCSDWHILAPELIYRGWLTPYQMREILEDRAESLILGSYTLLEPLGEGGMGRVFRARNWKIDKIVAVKVIRQEQLGDARVLKRFYREMESLGRVSHPNIILAFDAEMHGNTLFYAMEYIPGRDLGWHVRENGPLSIPAAAFYAAQVAHALQHVHMMGLIHRDLKPSNLLLTQDEQTVKILDLGLTRNDMEEQSMSQITRIGSLIGTPDYIAPEQISDPHQVDIRADLYSLGCTLYHLLTGQTVFEGSDAVEKLYFHVKEEPIPIQQLRPDIPPQFSRIIARLLAKRPSKRYQEPADLLE